MSIKKPQIFLLHFAGGNCYSFGFLKERLSADFEVFSLELPGRGQRIREPLIKSYQEAVSDYTEQIKSLRNNKPYIIYGHSMGALTGWGVVAQMERSNDLPETLIVTGNAGPGIGMHKHRYLLSNNELKEYLKELGGMSGEVLDNKELFDFVAPVIRTDFEILEKNLNLSSLPPIKTSMKAIMGDLENHVDQISNWKKYTLGEFSYEVLSGGHFFIYDRSKELTELIINCNDRIVVH